jgi:serine/threonine protein kinase/Tfp pilus assembly protein PilF
MKQALHGRVQFGGFELDPRAGELDRDGRSLILQEQQLQVLLMLIEHEGEIATREEIKKKLWPNDTIVEFDFGINNTVKNLRRALSDSADEPKYIETIKGRGYRLMVPVEWVRAEDSSSDDSSSDPSASVESDSEALLTTKLKVGRLTGQVVSHYRVLEVIGGGGMGLVYRAEDLKLGRSVALKFLPEEVGDDSRARERFEREAHAVSALNHTNICTVYDFDEHEGHPFIAMELLQGKTLRDHLADGRLRLTQPEGLEVAIQIASGLEAAHEKGIIHRDIKPANIFITEKNVAKILDFGVAKMVEAPDFSPARAESSHSGVILSEERPSRDAGQPNVVEEPAVSSLGKELQVPRLGCQNQAPSLGMTNEIGSANGTPEGVLHPSGAAPAPVKETTLTRTGLKLGTAGYMSPEQIRGEPLDARTDIFSFGLILYEMATGERAFTGETEAMLHDAIQHREPKPMREAHPELAPKVEIIVDRALEKDRERRYQSAAKILTALEMARQDSESEVSRHSWRIFALAILLFAVLAASFYWRYQTSRIFQQPNKLTSKDLIILAGFANSTGDAVFDGTLKQALAIQLEQSPFLNVLSDQRVSDTLKLMNRPPIAELTVDIAREVCIRSNGKALLAGSIAAIGEHFLLIVKAMNCETGETVASAEAEAQNRNGVLKALQDVGNQLRQKLGESLSSIAELNQPLVEATTSSLEALQAFALGMKTKHEKSSYEATYEAIPYYQQALTLDPSFALAHLELGAAIWDHDDHDDPLARFHITRAYELRNRVSQRERFLIEGVYYFDVTGELTKAAQSFTQMAQMYPMYAPAHANLGDTYSTLGQYEKAIVEYQQFRRMSPNFFPGFLENALAWRYTQLGRWQEAKNKFDEAEALNPSVVTRYGRYRLAFAQGDGATMQEQVAQSLGRPDGDSLLVLFAQSRAEGYHGRLAKAHDGLKRAMDLARQNNAPHLAASWKPDEALRDAEVGNSAEGHRKANEALQMGARSKDVKVAAALVFTRVGDTAKGRELIQKLNMEFPSNTLLQGYWIPIVGAASEMRRGNPDKALDLLGPASTYEMCDTVILPNYYAAYLRGLAYLELGQGANASREFQKILDHSGIVWAGITGALARLQLARAQVMIGDKDAARKSYQDFLTLWKDADPDIPIYKQAKAEYAKLNKPPATGRRLPAKSSQLSAAVGR